MPVTVAGMNPSGIISAIPKYSSLLAKGSIGTFRMS